MKLGCATIYFFSHDNEDEPLDALKQTLNSRDWVYYEVFNYKDVSIGEWYDDIDINKIEKCKDEETFRKYFQQNQITIQEISTQVAKIMNVSEFTGIGIHNAIHMVNHKFKEDGKNHLELTVDEIEEIKFKVDKILESWN